MCSIYGIIGSDAAGINPPASQQTQQLILNLNPGFVALLDSNIARDILLSLTGQINKLINRYIPESDVQKRKSKLEEMIEKAANMSTMLCGELKNNT